jgi:hypothetical protein
MTFGGAPCPSQWSCISNTGCDLATDLANNPDWDPLTLHSPHQHHLSPVLPAPADRPPPHPARELLFDFPSDNNHIHHKFDNYIHDLLGIGVEINVDSVNRLCAAGLLVPCRPRAYTRDDPNSLKKLAAEGLPKEIKIVLGIRINTYLLIASLPCHRSKACWMHYINLILEDGKVSFWALETLIGQLEHVCLILQP